MRSVGLALGLAMIAVSVRAQAPVVNAGGVVNDANYSSQGVAPGSIIGIFGTNLSSKVAIGDTVPLSVALDTVTSVTFNGVPAGLYFVGPLQINAQLPFESLASGAANSTVDIVVTSNTGSSTAQSVNVLPAVPGIFTANQTGLGQAIATDNSTNLIAAPANSIGGITTSPISISSGHALIVWCTGLGGVTPSIPDGANSFNPDGTYTLRNTVMQPTVTIGGVEAQFVYSILSPQYVGEYQIAVVPAAATPTGSAVSLQIAINGITTSNQVTLAVAP